MEPAWVDDDDRLVEDGVTLEKPFIVREVDDPGDLVEFLDKTHPKVCQFIF
jgi:hypothetical protein